MNGYLLQHGELCMMLKFLKNCVSHVEDITKMSMCLYPFFENQECVVCIPENIYYYLQRADSIMGVTYKKQDCMDYF